MNHFSTFQLVFFLGSQEVGVVEEIWNKTLGLGDLPRRARSERCFWAAFLAQRKIRASHRAPWKFQAEHPLLMRNITNNGTVFVMIWCGFAGDFITPMQHVRSPRENEQLTRFLHWWHWYLILMLVICPTQAPPTRIFPQYVSCESCKLRNSQDGRQDASKPMGFRWVFQKKPHPRATDGQVQ